MSLCRFSPSPDPGFCISAGGVQGWTKQLIDAQCSKAHGVYERDLKSHYVAYFKERPWLQCANRPHSARSLDAALPPEWSRLKELIPRSAWHLHCLSAKSSQTLALSIMGAAASIDPSFSWFWEAVGFHPATTNPRFCFERLLARSDLNEEPHTTQLDLAIEDPSSFVAVESKWTEKGFDICSCLRRKEGSHQSGGYCAQRIMDRPRYWEAAKSFFNIQPERLPLLPCQIAPIYQILRNIAAARLLAQEKRWFGFVLLHDENNPYFRQCGSWPGWPAVLRAQFSALQHSRFFFRALSWQQLMKRLPLDDNFLRWASEKHRLLSPNTVQ
jgi:hypothetical protein